MNAVSSAFSVMTRADKPRSSWHVIASGPVATPKQATEPELLQRIHVASRRAERLYRRLGSDGASMHPRQSSWVRELAMVREELTAMYRELRHVRAGEGAELWR